MDNHLSAITWPGSANKGPKASITSSPKFSYLPLLLIILVAFLLRTLYLEETELNPDESRVLLRYVTATIPEIMWQYRTDNQIFHSLLMRGAAAISATPFFVRFVTATLFSVLTVPLLYRVIGRLFNRQVALVSALLLACSTYHIYYAQDNRGYALVVFLSTLSTFVLYQALFKNSWRYWLIFIVTAVLNVYTHLFTLGLVCAQMLLVIWFHWYYRQTISLRSVYRAILAFTLIGLTLGLLYGPMVESILHYSENEQQIYGSDFYKFFEAGLSQHLLNYGGVLGGYIIFVHYPLAALILFLIITLAVGTLIKQQPFLAGWLMIWILVPCLLALLAFNIGPNFFLKARFLQFIIPPLLALLAYGSLAVGQGLSKPFLNNSTHRVKWIRLSPLLGLVLLIIFSNFEGYMTSLEERLANNWHQVVKYLRANTVPEDLIFCQEYNGPDMIFAEVKVDNECTRNIKARLKAGGYQDIFVQRMELQDWDALAASPWLNQPRRIWLVRWNIPPEATESYQPTFTAHFDKTVDVIASDSGTSLLNGALKIATIRTTFQEKPINQAVYWAQLSTIQRMAGDLAAAEHSWQQAASYLIDNPNLQTYLDKSKELLK